MHGQVAGELPNKHYICWLYEYSSLVSAGWARENAKAIIPCPSCLLLCGQTFQGHDLCRYDSVHSSINECAVLDESLSYKSPFKFFPNRQQLLSDKGIVGRGGFIVFPCKRKLQVFLKYRRWNWSFCNHLKALKHWLTEQWVLCVCRPLAMYWQPILCDIASCSTVTMVKRQPTTGAMTSMNPFPDDFIGVLV